ncbi:MAG TPA: adenylate/guanylate cyclase domain-containing protein [Terriglobales bacterium]|nr:adenylate/guanylate cyclase domain-containing protein [Terriglobales bacterium]
MASTHSARARRQFLRLALACFLLSAALLALLERTRAFQWLEAGTYDVRVRATARPGSADPNIVIIDVDTASFDRLRERLGRWPWTRRVWTQLVDYVGQGRPKAIVFDVFFAGASEDPAIDQEFAAAIGNNGRVVLAYTFTAQDEVDFATTDREAVLAKWHLLQQEARTGVAQGERISAENDPTLPLNTPLPQLAAAAAGLGAANATVDPDGVIRRVPLWFLAGSNAYPSVGQRAALLAGATTSTHPRDVGEREASAGPRERSARAQPLAAEPLDKDGRLLLQWHGNVDRDPQLTRGLFPYRRIPLRELAKVPPAFFQDKIVLVGASAPGIQDVHPTPFAEVTPGFLAHATAIDNLLHGEGIHPAPRAAFYLAVLLMAALGTLLIVRVDAGWLDNVAALVVLAAYLALGYFLFARWATWLPLVAPVSAFALAYLSTGAVRYATTGRELRRTRGTLDRYISPQLVSYVLEHLDSINLAGEKRELTIFFSDVRNFTTLTEKTDPTELIALLNEYLEAMTEIVFAHDGIVDKFIGDGILAYWGAFTPGRNHAELAARASLAMMARLEQLNLKWAAEGRQQLAIGVGLNTGEVVFGNVGSGKKIEFTVIGDPVNLAARLESLNKEYRTSIIISEHTLARLDGIARVRPLGGVKVKGKTVETQIFELQGMETRSSSTAGVGS